MNKRLIGSQYEQVAADYLKERGYEILALNYWCSMGEIDIVARDGKTLVFCEVKYRKNLRYGSPEEAVDFRKQNTILRIAERYMMEHRISWNRSIRFDVVTILNNTITLYKNAFGGM